MSCISSGNIGYEPYGIFVDVGIVNSHSPFFIRYRDLKEGDDILHAERLQLEYH